MPNVDKNITAVKKAAKALKRESGAAISNAEIDKLVNKLLKKESGAAVSAKERKLAKKELGLKDGGMPRKMNMGGAASSKVRAPSNMNCGLFGRTQNKMGGGKMKPVGMKGGGMPNIGKNNLRRP